MSMVVGAHTHQQEQAFPGINLHESCTLQADNDMASTGANN